MPVMAEELQPRAEILNTLVKVNDHYLKKHPDPLLGIPYYSRKRSMKPTSGPVRYISRD